MGDLELKGLPHPVPSVEVVWEPAQANEMEGGHFPLPARLVSASAESLFAFFGRAEELSRLTDTQKTCAAENRLRVVLISGEPGIGKTTLVAQAARAAHGFGGQRPLWQLRRGPRRPLPAVDHRPLAVDRPGR